MSKSTIRPGLIVLIGLVLTTLSATSFAANRVTTEWLAKNSKNKDLVLIDMNDGTQYQRFHISNAIHLPYGAINTRTKKNVSLSAGEQHLIKVLGQLGIKQDSQVVIYDDTGGLHASRLYWELNRLGHPRVAILDGGLVQWILEGRPVTQVMPKAKKTTYTPARKAPQANLATLQDVTGRTKQTVLLDVRSEEEYVGSPRYPRSGHIPGAAWWPWDNSVNFEQGFKQKDEASLKQGLKQLGVTSADTPILLYCRTGHRASQSYYTLKNLGFKNVKVYDASMAEYEQRKDLPLKKGTQP